jgi:hypothetical protein
MQKERMQAVREKELDIMSKTTELKMLRDQKYDKEQNIKKLSEKLGKRQKGSNLNKEIQANQEQLVEV